MAIAYLCGGPEGPPGHPDPQDDSPDWASSLQRTSLQHSLKLTRTRQEPETRGRGSASRGDDVTARVRQPCAAGN